MNACRLEKYHLLTFTMRLFTMFHAAAKFGSKKKKENNNHNIIGVKANQVLVNFSRFQTCHIWWFVREPFRVYAVDAKNLRETYYFNFFKEEEQG